MKSIEELAAMLPPPVSGITGCEAFNDRRKAAFDSIECAHRMASAKLDRLRPDAIERRDIERDFDKADIDFTVAVSRLARDRRTLLCEPATKQRAVLESTEPLRLPFRAPGATAFNARIEDFAARRRKSLRTLQVAETAAATAWMTDKSGPGGNAGDASTRAFNVAKKACDTAALPFVEEYKRLAAERAALVAGKKVAK